MDLKSIEDKYLVIKIFSNSIFSYDPRTRKWEFRCPMLSPRTRLSVAFLNGFIYAIGSGTKGRTVERYNPAENTWISVAPMNRERANPGIAVLNDKIYVVGGDDSYTHGRSVEYYDPELNKWTMVCIIIVFSTVTINIEQLMTFFLHSFICFC